MAELPPVLTLLVEKGPRKGQSLQHRAGTVLRVGRVIKGNKLAVGDAGASQRHLEIVFLPPPASRWAATDLGSSNGTLLNDTPLVPTIPSPLSHGDRIKIGESTVLAISIAADAGPEPAATRRSTRHAAAAAVAAAVEEKEEENKALAVRRGRRKAPAAADPPVAVKGEAESAPRGGRARKAPAAVDPLEEEKEEAAPPVTRRGGRKKAVERPEVGSEEEEVLPGGPSRAAPVTDAIPPQPQTTRSTRAAARRGEAVGTGQGKGEGEQIGRGRGRRGTRQSSRKAKGAIDEEEEEEVAVPEKQEGTTAKSARVKNDKLENEDGTSNESEVQAPVALREPAERTRKGRGRPRASTRKAKDPVIEEDAEKEEEHRETAGARECRSNPPQVTSTKEVEGTTGSGEVDGASKADGVVPLAESKSDGVRAAEEDGKREVSGSRREEGGRKNVSKCPEGCNPENMTLREWFVRTDEFILAKNHEATEKAIAGVNEKHRLFAEYIKTLK